MSRFRNEVTHLQAHVKTLRLALASVVILSVLLALGWWHAPSDLVIHVPPDLRSGSVRRWWDVPPESVYAFAFYVFQQLNRWPKDGEEDYARNIRALSAYLTPACKSFFESDFVFRRDKGELRDRVRGIYEIPGRGYGDDPAERVKTLSYRDWIVNLDLTTDEYFNGELVKRALIRYPIKVARLDVDPERNPFGLSLDCYSGNPQRIAAPPIPAPGHAALSGAATAGGTR